ncbi:1-phosphatidylinositol 4 5-bisphosphate phosphodiesterase delta-3-A [Dissostichus eleginoides]|nr:1-phosphatidylinositol 4 5-bisphosphate phosphodiesterase delta-3-A [Dissostichus eleginoides]
MEVECVREGVQSETLRQMLDSGQEQRCLTVVFKGPRKSLDLLCQSVEEAQHWARGMRTLQERVENMTQKEKLNQYPYFRMSLCLMDKHYMLCCCCFLDLVGLSPGFMLT